MNSWKPSADTSCLVRAMDRKSDCLLFDMASDAMIESGSSISLWDWLMFPFGASCDTINIYSCGNGSTGGYDEVFNDFGWGSGLGYFGWSNGNSVVEYGFEYGDGQSGYYGEII